MITKADIASGKVVDTVRSSPHTHDVILHVRATLATDASITSRVVSNYRNDALSTVLGRKVWIAVKVKFKNWTAQINSESIAKDPASLFGELFSLKFQKSVYVWDSAISCEDRERTMSRVLYGLIVEDEPTLKRCELLARRVNRTFKNRRKQVLEMEKQEKADFISRTIEQVYGLLWEIRNDIGEQDVVNLWRRVVVRDVAES